MRVAERKALVERTQREIKRLQEAEIITPDEAYRQIVDIELAAIWGALKRLERLQNQEDPGAPEASEAAPTAATQQPPQPCHDPPDAPINDFSARQIGLAKYELTLEQEAKMTRLLAPLVARAGGTVTLSAADLARPWSLSVMELPEGGVTLVAVELEDE